MPLLCPTCQSALDTNFAYTCGFQAAREDGVLTLMDPAFLSSISEAEERLANYREQFGQSAIPPEEVPSLPQGRAGKEQDWTLRTEDLAMLKNHVASKPASSILDIGTWNGWLAQHLAADGHEVTGLEFFKHPDLGLGGRAPGECPWQPIQMDLCDLRPLDEAYDVVIINHGIMFLPDPPAHINRAAEKLKPGGTLFILGLQFLKNPAQRIQRMEDHKAKYKKETGHEFFFRDSRGCLDSNDKKAFEKLGVKLVPYASCRKSNLAARIIKTRPWCGFGILAGGC